MVHKVLADSEAELMKVAQEGGEKEPKTNAEEKEDEGEGEKCEDCGKVKCTCPAKEGSALKVAEACELLADNLHEVIDTRSPTEKLAEYAAIQEALLKSAEDPPMHPKSAPGTGHGGSKSGLEVAPNTTSGENQFDGGDTGAATTKHQSPKKVTPTEHNYPTDAGNALETNKGMMFPEQPEEVLKQSADERAAGILARFAARGWVKEAGLTPEMRANVARVVGAQDASSGAEKPGGGDLPKGKSKKAMVDEAVSKGVPRRMAESLYAKFAADAENPAKITAGSKPELQSAPGASPVQSQGTATGEAKQPECCPSSGQSGGRGLISTIDSAIGYTKGQAKKPQKGALGEVLTEPALSSARDNVLQQALDSTSEAGVKISALRDTLAKIAASSPEAKAQLTEMVKAAQGGSPFPAPGEEVTGAAQALGATPPVSEEAMQAAADGVTTDELATAQVMLANPAAAATPPAPAEGAQAAPEAAPAPAPQAPPA
jgi:hypothetical protein